MAIISSSCSNNVKFEEIEESINIEIYNFESLDAMNKKIEEIYIIRKENEDKLYGTYIMNDKLCAYESQVEFMKLKYDDIKDDVENYHSKRLRNIYNLRKKLGFISLQSIADEINSLKLFDEIKANTIYLKYSQFLMKSEYDEVKSIYGPELSEILSGKGEVKINDQLLDLNLPNSKKMLGKPNNAALYTYDSGILTDLGPILIAWEVGKIRDRKNIFYRYAYYTRLTGFVKSHGSNYISYPISVDIPQGSGCLFKNGSDNSGFFVSFPNSGTFESHLNYQSRSGSFYLDKFTIYQSTFSANYIGQQYTFISNYLFRDYDIYNPNDPIYD